MPKILKADGTWYEGKASPELLREDLRKLPSDYITKDTSDDTKIHELDAPHVVEAIKYDKAKEVEEAENPTPDPKPEKKLKSEVEPGRDIPFTQVADPQFEVDLIRFSIIRAIVTSAAEGAIPEEGLFARRYVWFPKNNLNIYELRQGNPPANLERPAYLKNIDLFIDIEYWPKRITDALETIEGYHGQAATEATVSALK